MTHFCIKLIFRLRLFWVIVFGVIFSLDVHGQCTINAGRDTVVCQGSPLIRTAITQPTNNVTITWYTTTNSNVLHSGTTYSIPTNISGTVNYIVELNGPNNCVKKDTFQVTVNPSPSINAGGDRSVCQSTSASITATYSPASAVINWYAQGSGTSLATGGAFSYPTGTAGTFNYVVKIDSAGVCFDYDTVRVIVNPKPTASFTYSPNNGCPRSKRKIQFTSTSTSNGGGNLSYSWNFGDPQSNNNTSNNNNPQHSFVGTGFNNSGTFTVVLTVTTPAGCIDTDTAIIALGQFPDATLIDTINEPDFATCNGGNTLDLTVNNASTTPSINTNYQINWGDNTPSWSAATMTNVTHTYPALGYYTLTFIVTATGCKDSTDYRVFFGSNPGGSISSPSSTYGCTGQVFSFPFANVAGNTPGTEYIISVNDGSDTVRFTQENLPTAFTHIFDSTSCGTAPNNTFTVSYTISNPCGETPGTIGGIRISKKPEADFRISPNDTTCVNNILTFSSSGALGTVVPPSGGGSCSNGKQAWEITPSTGWTLTSGSLGNGTPASPANWTSGSDSIKVQFSTPGLYQIKYKTGTTACGQDDTVKTICVNPLPTAAISISADTIGCSPFNISAGASTNNATCGRNTYKWTVSYLPTQGCVPNTSNYSYANGTSDTSANPQFTFINPGVYTLNLQAYAPLNACSSPIVSHQVIVKGKPVVNLNTLAAPLCIGGTANPNASFSCYVNADTSFLWTFNGGTPSSSTQSSPGSVQYNSSGTFNVILNVTNICGTTADTTQVQVNQLPSVTGTLNICAGGTTQLTVTSTASQPGTWSSSNTSVATVNNTGLVTGITAGSAVITFTDGNGCSKSVTVTVNANVVPVFNAIGPLCSGQPFSLPTTSTNGISGTWSPAVNNTATTTYTFTPASGVCATSATMTVVINQPTVPAFTPIGGICVGGSFTLPTTSNNGISGSWSPAINNNTNTTYTFTPSVGQCATTTTITVAVNAPAAPTFTQMGPYCAGDNFSLPTTSDNGFTGTWSPAINNNATTTYTFTPNPGQCATATTTMTITITPLPVASISYGGPYCTTLTTAQPVTQTGATGGTYSSTTGLSINASTGAITPSSSTAGNYTVTYTIAAAGGCSAVTPTATLSIVAIPSATISYAQPFCSNDANAEPVTITGTTGGAFSSTTGLSINASTGAITPSTSTPGTYTVTYSIAAANGCAAVTATTSVTITTLPVASISYTGPYCTTLTTAQPVTQTGAAGGTYSSTTGLSINASTGAITPSSSTAGNYTVTYTIAAAGGCPAVTPTATLSIVAIPTATISYAQPFCSNDANAEPVTITGTTGGTFSSTTGLSINVSTGAITPSSSTPGTYTVTYSIAAANGCAAVTATTSVTITPLPTANIIYNGPYCNSVNTNQQVVLSGNSGGIFSSTPVGLGLNTTTGAVLPSASAIGNYNITYTLAAAGGCPVVTASASLVINSTPFIGDHATSICSASPLFWSPQNNPPTDIVPTGTTYIWQILNNNVFISGQGDSLAPPASQFYQLLQNNTNAPQNITYTVTPSLGNGANACTGSPFNLIVTVDPKPNIPTLYDTICSRQTFAIAAVNGVPNNQTIVPGNTLYSWPAPALPVNCVVTGNATGTNSPNITGTIINNNSFPVTVIYHVSATAGPCNGDTFEVIVLVNPLAAFSNAPNRQGVCNGGNTVPVNWTSGTAGATFSWTLQYDGSDNSGANNTILNGTTLPTMTLANTGVDVDSVVYQITSTASACPGDPAPYTILIYPDAKASFNYSSDTACWPFALPIINNSPTTADSAYYWYANNVLIGSGYTFPGYTIASSDTFIDIKLVVKSRYGCLNDSLTHRFYTYNKPHADFTASYAQPACGPSLEVSFTNLTPNNTPHPIQPFQYQWIFGNNQTYSGQNPPNVFFNSNPNFTDTTYLVQLLAFNSCDTTRDTVYITVKSPPKAQFAPSQTNVCSNATVTFTNTSLGIGNTYQWNFGDGSPVVNASNNNPVTHIYNTGIDTVFYSSIIATNECGVDYDTVAIHVSPRTIDLAWYIIQNTQFGCAPHQTVIQNVSTGATQFSWNFGDNNTVTTFDNNDTLYHTYNAPGIYTITVHASNSCTDTTGFNTVRVIRTPIADFAILNDYVCPGTPVSFSNLTDTSTGYLWNFGDPSSGINNTSVLSNPTHVYANAGVYTVTLQANLTDVSGVSCPSSMQYSVHVVAPDVQIVVDSPACIRDTLQFMPIVNAPAGLAAIRDTIWKINGVPYAVPAYSYPRFSHVFTQPGNYNVTLFVGTVNGCYDTANVTITVHPLPSINAVADQRICLGNAVQLNANSNAGNYQWSPSVNSGLSCYTCPNPLASPTSTTLYVVSTVNAFGCINSDSVKVTVIPPFSMSLQPLRDTICIGESVQLIANGASNYLWSPAATLSCNTCPNPIATPAVTTLYQVIGSDNYNCFKDTLRVEVAVGRYPVVTMPPSQVLSTGTLYTIVPQITNGPIVDYEWTPSTNLSCADCPHPVAIVKEDVCYQVRAENQYHCADTADFCIRAFCENTQVFIPNTFTPLQATNNIFRVRGTGIKSIKSFRVYNRWGEIVYERSNIEPNGEGWDGKVRGVMSTPDVFIYTAEVVCDNGVPYTYRGNVTLIR